MNEILYFGNNSDSAVVRTTDDPEVRIVKQMTLLTQELSLERKLKAYSKVAFGSIEYDLTPITKDEYDSFGITWYYDRNSQKAKLDKPLIVKKS